MAKDTAKDDEDRVPNLIREDRIGLYAARRFLGLELEKKLKLRLPFDVYFKDPLRAPNNKSPIIDKSFMVPWEPGLGDGPTSARFAVVDYDATANKLTPPAMWDRRAYAFFGSKDGKIDQTRKLDGDLADDWQFHQVSCWAILQDTLDYFEGGKGLGRHILWGFEGNRLIVVPHAGYGKNAYYDRKSKSLQFYYFNKDDQGEGAEDANDGPRIYTCLSSDIVNHEFGHAVLDGIRPHYLEAVSPETAAFHEFIGDLTAILRAFRNNEFRKQIAAATKGDLAKADLLASIAPQFGEAVTGQPYLRTGLNQERLGKWRNSLEPHDLSQVLTGTMFEIVVRLSQNYLARAEKGKDISVPDALWYSIDRMQGMAIQPLDFLPPVEVTFRDYALAVLRAEEVANPTDPEGYRQLMIDVFVEREILTEEDRTALIEPHYLFDRLPMTVFHDAGSIAESRANAYRFLDDNRANLFIPPGVDVVVSDVFTAEKLGRQGRRMPKQILVQYLWREELVLDGPEFGDYAGQTTSLLCGGTLALDEDGNVIAWARKPGAEPAGTSEKAKQEAADGAKRRDDYLATLKRRIAAGMVGEVFGGAMGLLATSVPLLAPRTVDGIVRFELTPHLTVGENHNEGGRAWQMSS